LHFIYSMRVDSKTAPARTSILKAGSHHVER
jgi:hypothetical protein